MDSLLRITVASMGESGIGLKNELQMLKSAILYADKVTLISPLASLYLPMEEFVTASTDAKLRAFFSWAEATGIMKEQFKTSYDLYRSLARKKRRTKEEILRYALLRRNFEKAFSDSHLGEMAKIIAEDAGTAQVKRAVESGILSVQKLETYGGTLADQYVSSVLSALLEQTSYPLLDSRTGNAVDAYFNVLASFGLTTARGSNLPGSVRFRGTQTHLNQVFTAGVPHFPLAPLDAILDIRSELQDSLTAYRAAVIEFSHEVESIPWSESFEAELDELYRRKVAPQVANLSEEVEENSELRVLAKRASESQALWGAAFGIVALAFQGDVSSMLGQLTSPALASSAAATVLPILFKSMNEHKKRTTELRRNPLYLLSQTEALLKKGQSKG